MSGKVIATLLWKDFRMSRVVFVGLLAMWAAPIAIVMVIAAYQGMEQIECLRFLLRAASMTTIAISVLTFAVMGGNVIASERVHRSAVFMAYLPPSRPAVLTSKAICAIVPGFAMLIAGMTLLYMDIRSTGQVPSLAELLSNREAWVLPATCVGAFGGAWLVGAIIKSPSMAVVSGLGVPGIVLFAGNRLGIDSDASMIRWYNIATSITGAACFALGAIIYLRAKPDV